MSPARSPDSRRAYSDQNPLRERTVGARDWGNTPPSSLSLGSPVPSRTVRRQVRVDSLRTFQHHAWYDDTFIRRDAHVDTRQPPGPSDQVGPLDNTLPSTTRQGPRETRPSRLPRPRLRTPSPATAARVRSIQPSNRPSAYPPLPPPTADRDAAVRPEEVISCPTYRIPPPPPPSRPTNPYNDQSRPRPPLANGISRNAMNGNGAPHTNSLANPIPPRHVSSTNTAAPNLTPQQSTQPPQHPRSFYQRINRSATVEDADDDEAGQGPDRISNDPMREVDVRDWGDGGRGAGLGGITNSIIVNGTRESDQRSGGGARWENRVNRTGEGGGRAFGGGNR